MALDRRYNSSSSSSDNSSFSSSCAFNVMLPCVQALLVYDCGWKKKRRGGGREGRKGAERAKCLLVFTGLVGERETYLVDNVRYAVAFPYLLFGRAEDYERPNLIFHF